MVRTSKFPFEFGNVAVGSKSSRAVEWATSSANNIHTRSLVVAAIFLPAILEGLSLHESLIKLNEIYLEFSFDRAAEVWMDDYKKHYFAAVPMAKAVNFGK